MCCWVKFAHCKRRYLELAWGLGYYTLSGEVRSELQAVFSLFLCSFICVKGWHCDFFSILLLRFCTNKTTQTALLFFQKQNLFYFCCHCVPWCLSSSETFQSVWIASELMIKVRLVLNASLSDHLLRKYMCKNCCKTFKQGRFWIF